MARRQFVLRPLGLRLCLADSAAHYAAVNEPDITPTGDLDMSTHHRTSRTHRHTIVRRKALALAIGSSIALAYGNGAFAQAVNGTIYGRVPVAANESIQITGGAGFNRTITVGPSGQYSITLPVGTYTVSLLQNGQVVQTRNDVSPVAAGAVEVDFTTATSAGPTQTLNAIN